MNRPNGGGARGAPRDCLNDGILRCAQNDMTARGQRLLPDPRSLSWVLGGICAHAAGMPTAGIPALHWGGLTPREEVDLLVRM